MTEERKPLCSIVIPAYNCEDTIEEALRSAMDQTLGEIEILVVDDASTDETGERVRHLAAKDSRIRLLHNEENRGVAESRNRGVDAARADWVAFLDGDDAWLPQKLEKQFRLQRETGAAFLYTGAICMNSRGETLERRFIPPERIDYRQLLRGNEIVCSSALARRELLLAHPMARSELHEDYSCWLQILAEGVTACGLPEPLLRYRLAAKSKSRNKLKSAHMTWQCYAYLGIPWLKRCGCFAGYVIHGLRRYFL